MLLYHHCHSNFHSNKFKKEGTGLMKPACNAGYWIWSLGWKDSLEKGMAMHSSILTWRIPWTEEPGGPRTVHGAARSWTQLTDWAQHGHPAPYLFRDEKETEGYAKGVMGDSLLNSCTYLVFDLSTFIVVKYTPYKIYHFILMSTIQWH